jgi:hypothetical protein
VGDGLTYEAHKGINQAFIILSKNVFLTDTFIVDAAIAYEDDLSVVSFLPNIISFQVKNKLKDGAGLLCVPRRWEKSIDSIGTFIEEHEDTYQNTSKPLKVTK